MEKGPELISPLPWWLVNGSSQPSHPWAPVPIAHQWPTRKGLLLSPSPSLLRLILNLCLWCGSRDSTSWGSSWFLALFLSSAWGVEVGVSLHCYPQRQLEVFLCDGKVMGKTGDRENVQGTSETKFESQVLQSIIPDSLWGTNWMG